MEAMVRYFFDIRDGSELYPDEEGIEFRDQKAAQVEAVHTLAGLARDAAESESPHDVAIEVRSDDGPLFHAALIFTAKAKH